MAKYRGIFVAILILVNLAVPVEGEFVLTKEKDRYIEQKIIAENEINVKKVNFQYSENEDDIKIDRAVILKAYGEEILGIALLMISILAFFIISSISANNKLKIQNKRYEILANISNEYLYEYHLDSGQLDLSEKCIELFETQERLEEVIDILKGLLTGKEVCERALIIRLPLPNDEIGVFRTINLCLYDDCGEVHSMIGKLMNISEEVAEKEALIAKTQKDGLTELYNAMTTRELINTRMEKRSFGTMDALIVMDCDNFKEINDEFGHLMGDEVLKGISESLKENFRESDIIGRIGGDEFCIYMKNIPSVDFVRSKCQRINTSIKDIFMEVEVTMSIGIAIITEERNYEELFEKADMALYEVKRKDKGAVVIFEEK